MAPPLRIGREVDNKISYGDNLTWQKGAHLLKIGGQAVRYRQNRYYAGNNGALGSFTFDGSYSGIPYGDFLLNSLVAKGRGAVVGKWGHRHWRDAIFIQDDWKLSTNLTVNLGMRWEYTQPIYEVADRQVNINTFTGQLLYAGKDGNSRALYNAYYKQFEPRVGIAWNPMRRLVVRTGYAISTFLEGTGANLRLPLNPPFFFEANVNYDPRTPGDIRVGFADTPSTGVLDSPRKTGANPYYQGRAWDLNLRPQFTQQYNATVEYQFTNTTSMTVAYVGQIGTHLVDPHEANNPLPGVGPVASWAPADDRRPLAGPLPNVGNIALTESAARMSYNALQVSGRHRLGGGLTLTGFYVWSKSIMDNLGYYGCASVSSDGAYWQDAYSRRANKGPACFDSRHQRLDRRRVRSAVRQEPEIRFALEQGGRPGGRRLAGGLLHERAFRLPGDRHRSLREYRRTHASRQCARERVSSVQHPIADRGPVLRPGDRIELLRGGRE